MFFKTFSYGRQTVNQDDIDAVVHVLAGDWLTQGPHVGKFEIDLAQKFAAKFVAAVANGTAGLHLIGLALGWQNGDVVLTTPITFLASANCILYSGATPDFVDIDAETYTIDIGKLEEKIVLYRKRNINVKAVVAVDYAGMPCDWRALRWLADKYQFRLINDNCHALGAEFNQDIGYAVKYADVVNMSFHPVKHITTGEGGAVLTNDAKVDECVKRLRSHGMTKDERYLTKNDGPWYYEMHSLGYNYRITDFQCALGSSQLRRLDHHVRRRNEIAKFYDAQLGNDERFIIPRVTQGVKHAYHLYPLQVNFESLETSKRTFFEIMNKNRIGLQVHYIPIHLQPFYRRNFRFRDGDFPVAEEFYKREVSIPIYPTLDDEDLEYIVEAIKRVAV